ncbi:MAG TPA: hypothetical protein H9708_08260 [Candidatus Borkfalkia stercoripullorum]|nr:hypothetical protein [Candidatus Borkfalkia stercoripullorum]
MFGYIQPDIPYLYFKDATLYKALYCGLCKSIGRSCGQTARFGLSYDMTFLSALLHNIKNTDVTIEKQRCAANVFTRRPMALDDGITKTVACLNTLLTYYKLTDDILDEHKGRISRAFFKRGYKKAKALHPDAAGIVKARMAELFELEKAGCASLDMAADPFGLMIADLSDYCLGESATEYTRKLFYGVGKWVYLIDALDDYDKDVKKKNYNPFVSAYKAPTKDEMLAKNREEVDFVFKSVFAENAECLKNIRFYFNTDLTDNIILRGMPASTRKVMCGCHKKVKPTNIASE